MQHPKTLWTGLAGIGGVVLVLIIATGIANCIDPSPACIRDPCWSLWLHCVWTILNSPALLALWATVASVLGLSEWRKELKGRKDDNAADLILRASYRFRDAFSRLRSRLIPAWESAQGNSRVVFEKRWGRFLVALDELENAIAEGAVLWGRDYRDRMNPVRESVVDLEFALRDYLEDRDNQSVDREKAVRAAQEFFGSGKQGDDIGKKLLSALQAIEADAQERRVR